ncbi:L,D-transpeptidase family protein [Profundibacter sp.]
MTDLVLTKQGVRFRNRLIPCAIGRGGISADKREGDGATPVGRHRITGLYYRPDRMRVPAPWAVPIRLGDLWSDDVNDPAYNHLVRGPHAFSHETMRRADPLYDMVLITDWNWPLAIAGKGSAIFLHIWRKPHHTTEGCVAFSKPNLLWIIQHLTPQSRLIVTAP